MEVTARATRLSNSDNNIKGLASVNFGNMLDVRSIHIVEGRDGNMFVSMPSYKTKQVGEDGRNVYADYCNPISKEFRERLYEAIMESFTSEKPVSFDEGKEFKMDVRTRGIENAGSLKGSANLYVSDEFVINNVLIREGKNGQLYSLMPSYKTNKTDENGKAVYQEVAYAHTNELKQFLNDAVIKKYRENLSVSRDENGNKINPFTGPASANDSLYVHTESGRGNFSNNLHR